MAKYVFHGVMKKYKFWIKFYLNMDCEHVAEVVVGLCLAKVSGRLVK